MLPTVADSHPKQFAWVVWPICKMEKILILADDDPVAIGGIIPYFDVRCFVQVEVEEMAGIMSPLVEKTAESFRDLIIHQEIHALVSTT